MAKGDIITTEELRRRHSSYFNRVKTTEKDVVEGDNDGFLKDTAQGLAKSAGKTLQGVGSLGRGIQKGISKATDRLFGTDGFGLSQPSVFDDGSDANNKIDTLLERDTAGEKFGGFVGDVAQFAIPGNSATKATKGASLLTRSAAQGVVAGSVQAAQSGDIGKDEAVAAIFGAASVPAGDAIQAAAKNLSKTLPEWLVRPLIKQTKTAKEQGKDITSFMVETGRIGSVDDLIQKSATSQKALNSQIDDILSQTSNEGSTIKLSSLIDELVDDVNTSGGKTSAEEVRATLSKIAFKSRGVLQSDELPTKAANTLRSQLDDTLYQGKDYLRQTLPENREILRLFTNKLRNSVQTSAPATKELFNRYSKEITLKEALISAASSSNGRNSIGMLDLLVGGGALQATGDPFTAVAVAGGRRAFETPQVKTALAAALSNTDNVADALAKASPATRGVILDFLSSLDENRNKEEQI